MATPVSLRSSAVRALSLLVALGALGFAACSSDDNAAPSQPPTFGNAGSAGSGTGGSAGAAAGSGGTAAGAAGTSGGAAGTDAGGAAGTTAGGSAGSTTGGSAGTGSGGCSTTPTTTTEFLNRCSDNSCTPFDNKTRIPGFTGTLPPLP